MIVVITALSRPQLQEPNGETNARRERSTGDIQRQAIALEIESRLRHNLRMKRRWEKRPDGLVVGKEFV